MEIPKPIALATEITLEPADLCDFTIHFKDRIYHAHSQILSAASNYFRTAAKAARDDSHIKCCLTDTCQQGGHYCITLPESIGGKDVSMVEFTKFLNLLYHPESISANSPAGNVTASFTLGQGGDPGVKFTICNGTLLTTFVQGSSEVLMANSKRLSNQGIVDFIMVADQREPNLNTFVQTYDIPIQLAIYFDCQSLLLAIESHSDLLFKQAVSAGKYDLLWLVLPTVDTCRWKFLPQLMDVLAKDTDAKDRASMKTALQAYREGRGRMETLASLFEFSMSH